MNSAAKRFKLSAMALSAIALLNEAQALDFSGYMRAGVGQNTRGGTQVCFQLPGADTKWRLGNECDYVIEPNFDQTLAKSDEYGTWGVHLMPSVYRAWGDPVNIDQLVTRFGQVYLYGSIPQLNSGKLWAGRRFYDRVQLGINDQFLENHDGDGAGIEDIELGGVKLSYGFLMNPNQDASQPLGTNISRYTHSFRVTDIKTIPDSKLAIYFGVDSTSKSDDVSTTPVTKAPGGDANHSRLGLYHITEGTLGGSTFLGAKFEKNQTGIAADDSKLWRIVLQQTGYLSPIRASWDFITEYRVSTVKSAQEKWFSIGGRLDKHISGPFRAFAELGNDNIKPETGNNRNMTKLTVGTAVSAGKEASSRPTFRLFYTYAKWNEAARVAFTDNRLKQVFGNTTSGSSIGAQVEAWW